MKKNLFLPIAGTILIILGITEAFLYISVGEAYNIIWFCNHVSIILGIAFLFRSAYWITAEISIGLIPIMIWVADYMSKLLFDRFIFDVTGYMFEPGNQLLHYLSFNHIFIIPVALIGLWYAGKPVYAWKGAVFHGMILFIVSLLVATNNPNCFLKPCFSFIPSGWLYPIFWLFVYFIAILLTNWLLIKAFRKLK